MLFHCYFTAAYDPPFTGVHTFIKKDILTPENSFIKWEEHDINFDTEMFSHAKRTYPSNTPHRTKELEVCLAVSMATTIVMSHDYSIISPVCFVSCKYKKPTKSSAFSLTLPHAIENAQKYHRDAFKILSLATRNITTLGVESPTTDIPENAKFAEIDPDSMEFFPHSLKFKSSILNPSLFAIGMRNEPSAVPKPFPILKCALFCVYECYNEYSKISQIRVKFYVGMRLKTVQKVSTLCN